MMEALVSLLDGAAVSVFGAVLSASFCDCLRSRRSRVMFWCGLTLLLFLLRFVSPAVRRMMNRSVKTQCQFILRLFL